MGNSVGRTSPKGRGREGFTRAGASSRLVYMLPPWNVTNLAQQVDMAICACILYIKSGELYLICT